MKESEPRVVAKSLRNEFASLKDPRVQRTRLHSLNDILVITICGFVCGVDNWVDLERFGKAKLAWFKTFRELPSGIPSHDTFGRLYAALDPVEFSRCFARSDAGHLEGDGRAVGGPRWEDAAAQL